ncbi:hypothetical protein HY733_03635 [Candidatus Uhrbacteria bacterium]|nr:hypothetical protein [Candidatus Uhrbacteria bacterium]
MPLAHSHFGVTTLAHHTLFVQQLLNRIRAHGGFQNVHGITVLALDIDGGLNATFLEAGAYVVWIQENVSLCARLRVLQADGACSRAWLDPWRRFVNQDIDPARHLPGVHLWHGAAWRHVPAALR